MGLLKVLPLLVVFHSGFTLPPTMPVQEITSNSIDRNTIESKDIDAEKRDNFGSDVPDGHTCIERVMMVEEMVFDEEERCNHIFYESCHQTYKTVFKPTQIEKCKDVFKKSCSYTFKSIPQVHEMQVCNDNIFRNCESTSDKKVCSKEPQTICETEFIDHTSSEDGTTKVMPKTKCSVVMREVCGPETCPLEKGEPICRTEKKMTVQEVPEEQCSMIPTTSCDKENVIVPGLEPAEECVEVPKEMCALVKVNPRMEGRPVIKQWCGPIDTIDTVVPTVTTPSPVTPSPTTPTTQPPSRIAANGPAAIIAKKKYDEYDDFEEYQEYEGDHHANPFRHGNDFSSKNFRLEGLEKVVGGPIRQFKDAGAAMDFDTVNQNSRTSRWSNRMALF